MAFGRWRDPASTVVVCVVALIGALTSPQGRTPLDALGVVLLLAAGLATAARARAPLAVLGLTVVAGIGYEALGYPGLAPIVPFLVALANAAWRGHRRPALLAVAVMVAAGLLVQQTIGSAPTDTSEDVVQRWFLAVGWMVAAIVAGTLAARYQAYLAAVEERAEEAERTREEVARRRADEERLRIARELHDSLTHSISIIKVQAGVAIHLARKRDEPVPEALLAIEQAGAEAMRELRATLEVLRGDEDTGSGLDRLDHLVEGARQAGLPITLDLTGDPADVPAPVGRAAYRIIQEALTNVRRHAGPEATASVRLALHPGELTVRIDDDGPGTRPEEAAAHSAVTAVPSAATAGPSEATAGPSATTAVPSATTGPSTATAGPSATTASGRPGAATSGNGAALGNGATAGDGIRGSNGSGAESPAERVFSAGVGLRGMRERVAALGGSLEAGPTDGGGFRVHARIPLGTP